MDTINLASLFGLFKIFGIPGLVITLWWLDARSRRRREEEHTKEVRDILAQYQADMQEIRRMYESNVKLVQGYEGLAHDLKDVVIMNTQAMQKISDNVKTNQFCPMVRLEKKASGPVKG